jgi:hypothetical protein
MTILRKQSKPSRRVDVVRCSGHLAHVRNTYRCIVPGCERNPIQAMHVVPPGHGRMGSKTGDDRVCPGCAYHHTDGPTAYHKIGRDKFEKVHGVDFEKAIAEINRNSGPLQRYYARQRMTA